MTDWQPANDVERALADAAATDDRAGFCRLLTLCDLHLPQVVEDAPEQRFLTMRLLDETFLPVFTSLAGLAAQTAGLVDGYTTTTYAELSRGWPQPHWRLAVNPGTPIDAYLPIEAVASAALGDAVPSTLDELAAEAAADLAREHRLAARHAERADLLAAARAGDVYGYLQLLCDAVVLIPTAEPVTDPASIVDGAFPWRPAGPPSAPVIEVFTPDAAPHPPYAEVALPFALAVWPEGHGITVNPGSPESVTLPPEYVFWLLTWERDSEPFSSRREPGSRIGARRPD